MHINKKKILSNYDPFLGRLTYEEKEYPLSSLVFFDIETTGLDKNSSMIYLIGCMYYRDNSWNIIQWLASTYIEESQLLLAFEAFIKDMQVLLHFNGTAFDLPFVMHRAKVHGIALNFNFLHSIDIYKELLPMRPDFLSNMKLTNLCEVVGFHRKDSYSGKELIVVYRQYVAKESVYKLLENRDQVDAKELDKCKLENKKLRDTLFLHNEEDISSLLLIYGLIHIRNMKSNPKAILCPHITVTLKDYVELKVDLMYPLPTTYSSTYPLSSMLEQALHNTQFPTILSYCKIEQTSITVQIPFITGTLKHFFSNYKDYYYLPIEDYAIHKSIAEYVEKEYREKARKETSYVKKYGVFIPAFLESYKGNTHKNKNNYPMNSFFIDYLDKIYFIEKEEFKKFKDDEYFAFLCNYLGNFVA